MPLVGRCLLFSFGRLVVYVSMCVLLIFSMQLLFVSVLPPIFGLRLFGTFRFRWCFLLDLLDVLESRSTVSAFLWLSEWVETNPGKGFLGCKSTPKQMVLHKRPPSR